MAAVEDTAEEKQKLMEGEQKSASSKMKEDKDGTRQVASLIKYLRGLVSSLTTQTVLEAPCYSPASVDRGGLVLNSLFPTV